MRGAATAAGGSDAKHRHTSPRGKAVKSSAVPHVSVAKKTVLRAAHAHHQTPNETNAQPIIPHAMAKGR